MRRRLLDIVGRLFLATGLDRWYAARDPNRYIVLLYHGVAAEQPGYYNWCQIPLDRFRWQLDYLRRRHRVVPVDQIVAAAHGEAELPPRAAAITFDDGYRNNATRAVDELRRRKLPATIYLTTGCVEEGTPPWPEELYARVETTSCRELDLREFGEGLLPLGSSEQRQRSYATLVEGLKGLCQDARRARLDWLQRQLGRPSTDGKAWDDLQLMSWDQARQVSTDGLIHFGAHTRHHEILSRLDDASVEREIVGSCEDVQRELGLPALSFAYPNGRPEDFDERAIATLRRVGVRCAFTTLPGGNRGDEDPYRLRRISVGADTPRGLFVLACCGALERWRRRTGRR